MSKDHTPKLPGFRWETVEVRFSSDSDENPLFRGDDLDPEAHLRRQLSLIDEEMEEFAQDPGKPLAGRGAPVHLGLDSEYQFDPESNSLRILSYQYYLMTPLGILAGIVYPTAYDRDGRIDFNVFLGHILHQAKQEDMIESWPEVVFVYAPFLRADLTTFRSFWKMKHEIDAVRGGLVSMGRPYQAALEGADRRQAKPGPLVLRDKHRHARLTFVRFVDTMPLTPGGAGLAEAGQLIGLPKLSLPQGHKISEMECLLRERPDDFVAYAMRDAEIAVRYGLRLRAFVKDELELSKLPPTIGSLAATVCRRLLTTRDPADNGGTIFNDAFGLTKAHRKAYWDSKRQRAVMKRQTRLDPGRDPFEDFVAQCYHGGRNECFLGGPTEVGDWYDFDLAGAYTTGMIDLHVLDHDRVFLTKEPAHFQGHVCGFALVDFAFPDRVRFPCLPVRTELRGLYFPRRGTSYCTAPEIALALTLGCHLRIRHGVVVPWIDSDRRLFEPFVRLVRAQRQAHKKHDRTFEEKLWKEIGNSVYGKTAQGLKEKSVFDPRTGRGKTVPRSSLTHPYIAAHVTGFVRAVVSELIARVPAPYTVVSVTTDGFLTDAPLDKIDCSGPMAQRFQDLVERLDQDPAVQEAA